tara:strand:+ start:5905 stop:6807 length:903 start_codon:yes stop_codon:yes gene_type:complete
MNVEERLSRINSVVEYFHNQYSEIDNATERHNISYANKLSPRPAYAAALVLDRNIIPTGTGSLFSDDRYEISYLIRAGRTTGEILEIDTRLHQETISAGQIDSCMRTANTANGSRDLGYRSLSEAAANVFIAGMLVEARKTSLEFQLIILDKENKTESVFAVSSTEPSPGGKLESFDIQFTDFAHLGIPDSWITIDLMAENSAFTSVQHSRTNVLGDDPVTYYSGPTKVQKTYSGFTNARSGNMMVPDTVQVMWVTDEGATTYDNFFVFVKKECPEAIPHLVLNYGYPEDFDEQNNIIKP